MTQQLPPALRDYFKSSPVALSLGEAVGDHPLLLTNQRFRDLTGFTSDQIANDVLTRLERWRLG